MEEMFGLLKELTTSRNPKKERNSENNKVVDKNIVELSELNAIVPKEVVDMKKEVEDGANDEPIRNIEDEIMGDGIEELVEMPRSHTIRYYLKHEINEKLVEGLIGIVEDVLVEIAGYIYPVDFVILDIKEDKKKPFILRTPFLTTAKAEIRFDKETITLKSGKNNIIFFKILESLCRAKEGTESDIDPTAPTTTVMKEESRKESGFESSYQTH
uniref:Reverse transcriptase domain-containing protein n=1 Tax=Tanacetum cinerariifolium TaxID=118510 RepID=A0A699JP73_TANCI|nr:hypothetical protein [Tanacetum cinerariifolium]